MEDDPVVRANHEELLEYEGLKVLAFEDGASALEHHAALTTPCLALLDVTLQGNAQGGLAIARQLRGTSASIPILFLSSRSTRADRRAGLDAGGDAYFSKDDDVDTIIDAVKRAISRQSALTRAISQETCKALRVGQFVVGFDPPSVSVDGLVLALTLTEWSVLAHEVAKATPTFPVEAQRTITEALNWVPENDRLVHLDHVERTLRCHDVTFGGLPSYLSLYPPREVESRL